MSAQSRNYTISPLARSDLEDIWFYYFETWSPDQADIYHRKLVTRFEKIAAGDIAGRNYCHVREGYFQLVYLSHLIFYRKTGDGFEITRILHQSMDIERHI